MTTIESRPQTPQMQHARALLATLDAQPDPLDALPAIEALANLNNVSPPYPPCDPLEREVTVQEALEALTAAARVTADPQEALRIALAAESLTTPL